MLALPVIQLNVLFKGKNCNSKKNTTISKKLVPTETYFIFKSCSRLSSISFFQINLASPCTWGFLTSLTIKSNKMTLLDFWHSFFILTSTDEKCNNARVY